MNATVKLLTFLALTVGLTLAAVTDAEARRFGGGRSFGGKSTFGSPYSRSATKPRTATQQAAFNQNQAARAQMAQRGGLMGMLGGLALGGLLGALFFGGAFEGLNFLDILLFAGVAFLLFKLLSARRGTRGPLMGGAGGGGGYAHQDPDGGGDDRQPVYQERRTASGRPQGGAGFDTDLMFERGKAERSASGPQPDGGDAVFDDRPEPAAGPRPDGFDEREFLAGATRAFEILQKGWNDGDLSEIRGLTTDEMFAMVQDQYREEGADTYVELLKVDAELLDARQIAGTQEATVLFDAILRESEAERPAQVREVWHFTRSARSRAPRWFLDGIQQLED